MKIKTYLLIQILNCADGGKFHLYGFSKQYDDIKKEIEIIRNEIKNSTNVLLKKEEK